MVYSKTNKDLGRDPRFVDHTDTGSKERDRDSKGMWTLIKESRTNRTLQRGSVKENLVRRIFLTHGILITAFKETVERKNTRRKTE